VHNVPALAAAGAALLALLLAASAARYAGRRVRGVASPA
jgi:hypothetical protein